MYERHLTDVDISWGGIDDAFLFRLGCRVSNSQPAVTSRWTRYLSV